MEEDRYEVITNVSKRSVAIRLWGAWTKAEAGRYERLMTDAIMKVSSVPGPWTVLADITESPLQTQEVQDIRKRLLELATRRGMVKVAYVVNEALTKMQMGRLASAAQSSARFFQNKREAIAWLAQP